jgi:hypothetical protein
MIISINGDFHNPGSKDPHRPRRFGQASLL